MFYGFEGKVGLAATFRTALADLQKCFRRTYANDMLITFDRNVGFLEDHQFMSALESSGPSAKEQSLVWRVHVLAWAASHALQLEGDFVECGVFRGFSTAVLASFLDFASVPKQWYLYDTFSGVPEDQENAGSDRVEQYEDPSLYDSVRTRFAGYPNVIVIRGRVPEVLLGKSPERVALLHLDMNSAAAEIGALDVLFSRVVPGGIVVLDDYGWLHYREQKDAEDDFFDARGYRVLELPTGQGIVLKR
jgi:O-methyltransferase